MDLAEKKVKHKKKAKTFFKGFKDFISRGNIIDLAVGVIIGGAFGKIVTSLVNDIITPPISLLFKGEELKDATWIIREKIMNGDLLVQAEVAIRYGKFLTLIIEFIIIAFSIYAVLTLIIRRKQFNEKIEAQELAAQKKKDAEELAAMKKKEEKEKVQEQKEKEVVVSEQLKLLTEIRDLLSK